MVQAQDFLPHVHHNAEKIGLHLNADKAEFMIFNQEPETALKSVNNENIKKVHNFKYLRAWINIMENGAKFRETLVWKSCNKLNKTSSLSRSIKLRTFSALAESELLYGSETRTQKV